MHVLILLLLMSIQNNLPITDGNAELTENERLCTRIPPACDSRPFPSIRGFKLIVSAGFFTLRQQVLQFRNHLKIFRATGRSFQFN